MTIINQYVELAKRTESIVSNINDIDLRLLHSSIGLATEIIELNKSIYDNKYGENNLDIINIREEIGDCFWYIAIACDVLNLNFSDTIKNTNLQNITFDFQFYANKSEIIIGEILDICKRHIYYKKQWDKTILINLFKELIEELYKALIASGVSLEDELEKNIDKLRARYPEKYTDYHAINRDLEAERKILEK